MSLFSAPLSVETQNTVKEEKSRKKYFLSSFFLIMEQTVNRDCARQQVDAPNGGDVVSMIWRF